MRFPVRPSGLVGVSFALALTLGIAVPTGVSAQLTRADSAAVILATATAFEQEGRRDVATALYDHLTERFGDTPAAAVARARLADEPEARVERASRVELPIFGATFGLWLGVAVPAAFGADSEEAYGAGLLLGGPAGLLAARAYTRSRSVSEGQARAISWGGIWGTWQGLGWAEVFDLDQEEVFCDAFGCYDSGSGDPLWASMVAGGLAGIVTGALIARGPVASGVASGAQAGSTWGSIYGAVASVVFGVDNEDNVLVVSLLTGNLGLAAGAGLARKHGMSRGRVRLIDLGALLGGIGGLGLDLLVQPDSDEVAAAIPLLTSMIGMGVAFRATRARDRGLADPGGGLGGALFEYERGALRLGTPLPAPALLPFDGPDGRPTWRPGLSFELLRARFR